MGEVGQAHQYPHQSQGRQGEMQQGLAAFAYHVAHGEPDIARGTLRSHWQKFGNFFLVYPKVLPHRRPGKMLKIANPMSFPLRFVTI